MKHVALIAASLLIAAIGIAGDLTPPKVVKHVNPTYPEAARKAGIEGDVILQAIAFQHIGILSLEFHVDKLSRPLL